MLAQNLTSRNANFEPLLPFSSIPKPQKHWPQLQLREQEKYVYAHVLSFFPFYNM